MIDLPVDHLVQKETGRKENIPSQLEEKEKRIVLDQDLIHEVALNFTGILFFF